MGARAMWKGVLHVGSHAVPVKLYAALQDRGVHFRLLDPGGRPVSQRLVDPSSEEVVPYSEVQRGYAVPEGFVLLHKEELDRLAPEPSRDIQVSSFVSRRKLGPEWYLRSYYLGPDGDGEAYFALAEALRAERKEGLAHWVMRGHEYTAVLTEREGYLMLTTVRHADEVIAREDLPRPEGRAHSERELQMAEQLVAAYEDAFDPHQYRDEYRERVLAFVEEKAQGKKPRLKKPVAKRAEAGLAEALAKSVAAARKRERDVA